MGESEDGTATDEVVLLWRPGCGFCLVLKHRLDKAGLDYTKRNIWKDADAAALVRELAGGSETVPTVLVGGVGLVNPRSRQVLDAVQEVAPDRLPEGYAPPGPGRVARVARRLLGGRGLSSDRGARTSSSPARCQGGGTDGA